MVHRDKLAIYAKNFSRLIRFLSKTFPRSFVPCICIKFFALSIPITVKFSMDSSSCWLNDNYIILALRCRFKGGESIPSLRGSGGGEGSAEKQSSKGASFLDCFAALRSQPQ